MTISISETNSDQQTVNARKMKSLHNHMEKS